MATVAHVQMRMNAPSRILPSTPVVLTHDTSEGAQITAEVDVGALGQLLPSQLPAGARQRVGVEVKLSGLALSPIAFHSDELRSWSVERTWDAGTSWSADFAGNRMLAGRRIAASRVPDPFTFGAAPPGLSAVGVGLFYRTDTHGLLDLDLLQHGKSRQASRSIGVGDTISLGGQGPEAAVEEKDMQLHLEPGHGLRNSEVATAIAEELGFTAERIQLPTFGERLHNELAIDCEPGWQTLLAVCRAAGYAAMLTRESPPALIAKPIADTDSPARWVFGMDDIYLGASVTLSAPEAPATCWTVTGSKMIVPGANGETGTETETTAVEVREDAFVIPSALWRISGGVPVPVPPQPPRDDVLTSRTTTTEVRDLATGCLVVRTVVKEAYRFRETPRYQQTAAGELIPIESRYLYDADGGDNAPASDERYAPFREVERIEERPVYDEDGYQLSATTNVGQWKVRQFRLAQLDEDDEVAIWFPIPVTGPGLGTDAVGEYYYSGIAQPDASAFAKRPSDVAQGIEVAGFWFSSTTTTPELVRATAIDDKPRPTGEKTAEAVTLRGWGTRGTGPYLYGDGTRDEQQEEPGRILQESTKSWAASSQGGHTLTEGSVANGVKGPTTTSPGDGDLPSAEFCSPEDRGRDARQPIRATVCAVAGQDVPKEGRTSSSFVESTAAAELLAAQELRMARAWTVDISMPPAAPVEPLDVIEIDLAPLGPAYSPLKGWVDVVSWSGGSDGEITMDVTVKVPGR
jgi:hypothetical protein